MTSIQDNIIAMFSSKVKTIKKQSTNKQKCDDNGKDDGGKPTLPPQIKHCQHTTNDDQTKYKVGDSET